MAETTKNLICPDCGKEFSRPASLGAHRSKAHGYRSERTNGNEHPGPAVYDVETTLHRDDLSELSLAVLDNFGDPLGFHEELAKFLPVFAQETRDRFRRGDSTFVDPFLTLFLDQPVD